MKWLALALLSGCGSFAVPGRACQKHEECGGLERGYCARAEICTRECSEGFPCPDNARCSQQSNRAVCLPTCDNDQGCFKGFTCRDGVCQVTNLFAPPGN
jgi:hypothetical protein